ncbi:MAG: tryptophan synthase subunit alpha [Betaproteobacteria bacterium]|nr:tryptophan synthase subunit alpha [Betaproteobacteria bacterium]
MTDQTIPIPSPNATHRISERFRQLRAAGKRALIPYAVAGHPTHDSTLATMHAMVDGGADIIELGVPFSDPMADGPVIQRATEAALANGTRLRDVLAAVTRFRQTDSQTPVVLMGYLNPIERMGTQAFAKAAEAAGVDGVLVVDLPPEEADELVPVWRTHGIDPIFLLAPTSTPDRIAAVAKAASGYVYYVSLNGVTGAALIDLDAVLARVEQIQAVTGLPVGVGFGIRDAATAKAIAARADAIVIGSKLIQIIEDGPVAHAPARVTQFLSTIRQAIDTH